MLDHIGIRCADFTRSLSFSSRPWPRWASAW